MAYCDFCSCSMCQTGCSETCLADGSDVRIGEFPVLHTQTVDGRWICSTCYTYDCCANAKSDPCKGLCGEKKCEHRPKLVNGEWTFWTYQIIDQSPKHQ
jgi:hypothetical protein